MTGGLDVSAHTASVMGQFHSAQVRLKPAASSAQSVKLDPCFAPRVASWWIVCKTRDIWLQRVWNWRGE